jgi:hypothetical protein
MRIDVNRTKINRFYKNINKKSVIEIDKLNVSMKERLNTLMIHNVYVDNPILINPFSKTVYVERRIPFGLYSDLKYNYGKWIDKCDVCNQMSSNEFIYDSLIFSNIQYVIFVRLCDTCLKCMKCQDIQKIKFEYENYNLRFRKYISSKARNYLDKQLHRILSSKNII